MAINPHLTPTTYGKLRPGDRIITWPLNPARPDAHLLAQTVAEIVGTRRHVGRVGNWALPRAERLTRPRHGSTRYDYTVIEWRDTNGSLHEDRTDETVYIVTTD